MFLQTKPRAHKYFLTMGSKFLSEALYVGVYNCPFGGSDVSPHNVTSLFRYIFLFTWKIYSWVCFSLFFFCFFSNLVLFYISFSLRIQSLLLHKLYRMKNKQAIRNSQVFYSRFLVNVLCVCFFIFLLKMP